MFDYIAETGRFTEELARYYFHQLCEALLYMQEQGISHRDLKTENLMLDGEYNLKIIDYGFASTEVSNRTRIGTPEYMAPEIAKRPDILRSNFGPVRCWYNSIHNGCWSSTIHVPLT